MSLADKPLNYRQKWMLAGAAAALALLCVWALGLGGPGKPDRSLYRVVYNNNPPYYYQDEDGQPKGAMVELFREAAQRAGLQLEWVFHRGAPEDVLRADKADLLMLTVNTELRRKEFHMTEPWMRVEGQLLWRKQPGDAGPPDFRGHKIGIPGFRLYDVVVRKQFAGAESVRRGSRIELLEMLCSGELEGVLMDSRSLATVLLDRPRRCDGIALGTDSVDHAEDRLVIMSRRDAAVAAELIRQRVSAMTVDGSIRKIYQRYGVGYMPELRMVDELEQSHAVNQVLLYALVLVVLALLIAVFLAIRLRRAERKAAEASRAKSAFLATMSHETRTPLNGIIGLAEALAQDSEDGEQRRMAQTIAQCGRSMVSLVSDVLDHSKMDAGKLEVERSVFSLRGMLEPIALNLGSVAGQKGLDFEWRVDASLPEWVEGDALRITQVLFNLLGNAVKFTEQGKVELIVLPAGGRVRFEVRDTGIGLTQEQQSQLFQAFWQAHQGTTRRFGGTGLGLSICRRLVEAMGGTIAVDSELGRGSNFAIELTLPERARPEVAVPEVPLVEPARLRVLFADDNDVNRLVVERMLERMGHSVVTATNGAEAVERFAAHEFDVVLLDCHMPVEDGFSACRRIRATAKGETVPVLALTALAFEEDRDKCLKAGMNGHVSKPVSAAALEAALRPFQMTVISSRS